jgi:hypothetical protein
MWRSVLCLLVLTACGAGDDTTSGARANCAEGGALTTCPDAVRTAEAACWKLVDCGVIPVSSGDIDKHFDWGRCVDRINTTIETGQELIIACIATSTCDALKVPGSPDDPDRNDMACFHLGGN